MVTKKPLISAVPSLTIPLATEPVAQCHFISDENRCVLVSSRLGVNQAAAVCVAYVMYSSRTPLSVRYKCIYEHLHLIATYMFEDRSLLVS